MPNAVAEPILNSPFAEPTLHWDFSGPTPQKRDGRRPASYYGTLRTDAREGIASAPSFELDLVNEIRARVRSWRERSWPGVTPVTRDLLEHWSRAERRPLFFAQREAAETLVWLTEAVAADRAGINVPLDAPNDPDSVKKGYQALRRWCTKMATGSGKTIVMGMVAAWSILNKLTNRQDARFADAVLVVGPNLTVKERLQVLVPQRPDNVYEAFDLVPASYRDLLSRGKVHVTNWHAFGVKDDSGRRGIVQRGRESDAAFVQRVLKRDLGNASNLLVMNDEAHHAWRPGVPEPSAQLELEDLGRDEKKELEELSEEATVWVGGLDRINKVRGIRLCVDLSATPFFIKGSGYEEGTPLPWIVSDFGLVDAIESGITKVPRMPVADDSGAPDPKYFRLWRHIQDKLPAGDRETGKRRAKPEAVWREAQGALTTLASKWTEERDRFEKSEYAVPPALIVVCANKELAGLVTEAVQRGDVLDDFKGDATFRIDTGALAEAEAAEDGTKADEQQKMRLKTATIGRATWPGGAPPTGFEALLTPPGRDVRVVVSVAMLTEGWDAPNVTQILGLRAFSSQLLCEQVVGRGLRRMSYDIDPATGLFAPEYCDVFGIPFEVIPVQGLRADAARPPPPSQLVQALPERKELAITFPRVIGYVADVQARVTCDVDKVESLTIAPQVEPTTVMVRTQTGWSLGKAGALEGTGPVVAVTREQFHEEHRLQRTAFEIARDIVEVFAGGTATDGVPHVAPRRLEAARLLFPQVLRIATDYLERRLVLASPEARAEDVALSRYRDIVVQRLLDAMQPEPARDSPPLLPRIERHRPEGTTAEVMFRTTKPVSQTVKSHVSHVVLDSSYESSAQFHLEQSPHVAAYVKNDRLDFEIPYAWNDGGHRYVPDFLVRLKTPDGEVKVIFEMKGVETEQDRQKAGAARKWVRAINHHGGFGRWEYVVCMSPNLVGTALATAAAQVRPSQGTGR